MAMEVLPCSCWLLYCMPVCVQLSARTPPWGAPSEVRGSGSDQQVRVAGISDSSSPVASGVPAVLC